MIIRFLFYFCVIAVTCGCTADQQRKTFKERYNIYADPKIDYSNKVIAIPGARPYPAEAFIQCGLSIHALEDFIDAIVRRMDAKNFAEYHAIQDQIDKLYIQLRDTIDMDDKTLHTWPEGYAYRHLLGMYMERTEDAFKSNFATVQYMKYLLIEQKM